MSHRVRPWCYKILGDNYFLSIRWKYFPIYLFASVLLLRNQLSIKLSFLWRKYFFFLSTYLKVYVNTLFLSIYLRLSIFCLFVFGFVVVVFYKFTMMRFGVDLFLFTLVGFYWILKICRLMLFFLVCFGIFLAFKYCLSRAFTSLSIWMPKCQLDIYYKL